MRAAIVNGSSNKLPLLYPSKPFDFRGLDFFNGVKNATSIPLTISFFINALHFALDFYYAIMFFSYISHFYKQALVSVYAANKRIEGEQPMTLYRFIASTKPLVEVGDSGFQMSTLEDYQKNNHHASTAFYFRLPHDEQNIIFVEDESKLGQLQIVKCDKIPHYIGNQIQKPYVYELHGYLKEPFLTQLLSYIQQNIVEEDKVEIWSIWHGEKVKHIKRMLPQEITLTDLAILEENDNLCLKFFRKTQKVANKLVE